MRKQSRFKKTLAMILAAALTVQSPGLTLAEDVVNVEVQPEVTPVAEQKSEAPAQTAAETAPAAQGKTAPAAETAPTAQGEAAPAATAEKDTSAEVKTEDSQAAAGTTQEAAAADETGKEETAKDEAGKEDGDSSEETDKGAASGEEKQEEASAEETAKAEETDQKETGEEAANGEAVEEAKTDEQAAEAEDAEKKASEENAEEKKDEEEPEEEAEEEAAAVYATSFELNGPLTIKAAVSETAQLPEDTVLHVDAVLDQARSDSWKALAKQAMTTDAEAVLFGQAYDIYFTSESAGGRVAPANGEAVSFTWNYTVLPGANDIPEDVENMLSKVMYIKNGQAYDAGAVINANAGKIYSATFTTADYSALVVGTTAKEIRFVEGNLPVFSGSDYTVTLSAKKDAKIPEGSTLSVRELVPGSAEYEQYLAAASAALGVSDKPTEGRFFDITIIGPDGKEVDPAANVTVDIRYPQKLEDVSKADVQGMVHFDDNGSTDVLASKVTTKGGEVSKVGFQTDSFSVFGMVYTVNFVYDGYEYVLPGEGEVLLSALFAALGIYVNVEDVANVIFSNPALVAVAQEGNDWRLTSLMSFETAETLTVEMKNGDKYVIDVTDPPVLSVANLKELLTDATIDATKDGEAYVLRPGSSYNIALNFAEIPGGKQFSNGEMTYEFPANLKVADGRTGKIDIDVSSTGPDGRVHTVTVKNNEWSVTGNVLHFNWNNTDPNLGILKAASNVEFNISLSAEFDGTDEEIRFSDTVVKNVKIDNTHEVTVSKDGSFNKTSKKMDYTVTVSSTGKNTDVEVNDVFSSGTAFTLDTDSISATSNRTGTVDLSGKGSATGTGFKYTFPSMNDGEEITFHYTASIDFSVIDPSGKGTIEQTGNTVTAKSHEDPEPDEKKKDFENKIDWTKTSKYVAKEKDGEDTNHKILTWTMTVNEDMISSVAGMSVQDKIGAASQSVMKYCGSGVTLNVYDSRGLVSGPTLISWDQLESHTDTQWKYKIPNSDAGRAYKYVFTYDTVVDVTGKIESTKVTNEFEGPGTSGGAEAYVSPGIDVNLKKSVVSVSTKEDNKFIEWKVSFDVPATGFTEAVVTDTYPTTWTGSKHIYEKIKGENPIISGLTDGEKGKWVTDFTNDEFFTITFHKSNGESGLDATGEKRTIEVVFKTNIDDEWETGNSGSTHKNSVNLTTNGGSKTAEASHTFTEITVSKKALNESANTFVEDGQTVYYWDYEFIFSGVSDSSFNEEGNLIITDTFNTALLKAYVYKNWDNFKLWGSENAYPQEHIYPDSQEGLNNKISHTETSTGLIFTIPKSSIPKKGDLYYPHYRIKYALRTKDANAVALLKAEAAKTDGGITTLSNKAEFENVPGEVNVKFKYDLLDKKLLSAKDPSIKEGPQSISIDGDTLKGKEIVASFEITFNPDAADINPDGDTVIASDTLENLSVDYDTIKAYNASGSEISEGVSWDTNDNVISFVIPDKTTVIIRYDARVISSGSMVNTATINGQNSVITKNSQIDSSGGGTASIYSIKLMKYAAGNQQNRLSGAKFALYKVNGKQDPVVDSSHRVTNGSPVIGKDGAVTYTTPESGIIVVYGDEDKDGWSIHGDEWYFLREIEAPEGYKMSSFDYRFKIAKNGVSDYDNYIYHSGDTMTAKNYPGRDINVVKYWATGYTPSDNDSVVIKLQQKIGENGNWSDTIRQQQNDSWVDIEGPTTITLSNQNEWKGAFLGLPITVPVRLGAEEDISVSYQIKEVSINGLDADTVVAGDAKNGQNAGYQWNYFQSGNTFTVTNTKKTKDDYETVEIKLHKKDDSNKDLSGVTFTLTTSEGGAVTNGSTDTEGKLTLTIPKTALGKHNGAADKTTTKTFVLTETVPTGYEDAGPWTVTVKANGTSVAEVDSVTVTTYKWTLAGIEGLTAGTDAVYEIENTKKVGDDSEPVEIKLHKKNDSDEDLSGVAFTLTTSEGGTVTNGTTDTKGKLTLTIPKTALGKHNGAADKTTTKTFVLTETVPTGYEDAGPWTVTVKANGTSVAEVDSVTVTTYKWTLAGIEGLTAGTDAVYEIENTKKVGDDSETVEIKLHKKNDSDEDLSGVTFTLTTSEGGAVTNGSTDTEGKLTLTIPKTALGKHNGAADKTTTKTFVLTETAPTGYEEAGPWTVTVKANGTSVTEVDNVTVTTYKWTLAGIEGLTAGIDAVYEIENIKKIGDEIETVEIKLHKKNDSDEDLSGVTFTLTTSEGGAVTNGSTDTEGKLTLTIPKTALGKHNGAADRATTKTFTLTETVPTGYEDVEPWTVTVKANGTSEAEVNNVTVTTYKWTLVGIEGLTAGTDAVYEIENTKKVGDDSETVEIKLHKITDSNADLSGVTFMLTDSSKTAVASGVTGTDGKLTLTIPKKALGKHDGASDKATTKTFILTETVPVGYEDVEPWKVTIKANGTSETEVSNVTVTTYKWALAGIEGLTAGTDAVYEIKNKELTEISVLKIWDDQDNKDGKRPTSVTVQLYKNNALQLGSAFTLNDDNGWKHTWTGLPKYADGKEIEYTVQETPVQNYTAKITGDAVKGYVISNTLDRGSLLVTKKVTVDGKAAAEGSEFLTKSFKFTVANGDKYLQDTAGLLGTKPFEFSITADKTVTFENLPIGEYTVTEIGTEATGDAQVENYSLKASATADGKVTVVKDGKAEVKLSNEYTGKVAPLVVKKTFVGLTDKEAQKKLAITITGKGINKAAKADEDPDTLHITFADFDANGEFKVEDLPVGETYKVVEENAENLSLKYSLVTKDSTTEGEAEIVETKGAAITLTNKYEEVKKPKFEKKIMDTNDTIGVTSGWQDSADYDIGDAVPYRLTATLASNVTDYQKYHITFHDTMEPSLTYNAVTGVFVNGAKVTDYTLTSGAHSFDLTLTWGDGKTKIADAALNGASVEVYFNAILNENAILGSQGNVNKCLLEYSCNPSVNDEGKPSEETENTPEDFVIAFTYKVNVNKVDADGKALDGAAFKLEKKLAGGKTKVVELDASSKGNVFSFKGLDDGDYVLTETTVPTGYKAIEPITFTVAANHNEFWTDLGARTSVLTSLTGKAITGEITFTADAAKEALTGDVKNSPSEQPSFEKKIMDTNDTTGVSSGWQDSADYDIGDAVPYRLTATLASNVTDYQKYHITFHDTMEPSLTFNGITSVTVNGEAADYDLTSGDHSFDLTLTWGDGKTKIADTTLDGASVEVYFSAILNENAILGSQGNVNKCLLEYSCNPSVNDEGKPSEEVEKTPEDFVIAFTYKVNVNKVDADGKALEGAAFKLEKKLAGGKTRVVELDASSKGNVFSFKGLDDGDYVLTETTVPTGYKAIEPITFTVAADHNALWTDLAARTSVLTSLTGKAVTGEITFTADAAKEALTGDVKNSPSEQPSFEKKIMDTNDTTGVSSGWQDSADYDIGDAVPYRLTATLASNVTDYQKYHITFHDTMELSLTFNGITSVTVNGEAVKDYALTSTANSFDLTLTWGDGKTKIADTTLDGASVEVYFNAILNENAILGSHGNVNTCALEYSCNPSVDKDGKPSEETKKTPDDFVIAFTYKVDVSKVDVDGKALEGAAFKLEKKLAGGTTKVVALDASSKGNIFSFKGLDDGDYVLTETTVPAGYLPIDPITFTVTADHNIAWTDLAARDTVLSVLSGKAVTGEITFTADAAKAALAGDVKNEQTTVKVSKVDTGNGEELEGATIQILDKEGKVVDEWISTKEVHEVNGLKTGEEYTLRETVAPEGYGITTDTTFVLDETGKIDSNKTTTTVKEGVLLVEDTQTHIKVSKVDTGNGEELEGATIQILDKEGKVVEEWVSGDKAHEVTGLKTGEEYTLRETVAPEGYSITTDTTFVLDETGKIDSSKTTTKTSPEGTLLVEDSQTRIKVKKTDIASGEELEGATIQILDKEGNVVEEWVSTKEAHEVIGLTVGEEYTLRETVAPEGYGITTDTTFVLDENGKVDHSKTTTKTDEEGTLLIEDGKNGAVLTVSKSLRTLSGDEIYAVDQTFYVQLFYDEDCTVPASDIRPLEFKNAKTSIVTFDVEYGREYYVAEVSQEGTVVYQGEVNETDFVVDFAEGNEIKVVEDLDGGNTVYFNNEFVRIPDNFYKEGELTVTKKVLTAVGESKKTDEIFYAGIFEDAGLTKLSTVVRDPILVLDTEGEDTATASTRVQVAVNGSYTLYIAEVDEEGNPVTKDPAFKYEASYDKDSVTITEESLIGEVTITNKEKVVVTPTPTNTVTPTPGKPGAPTGDNTDMAKYLAMLALAGIVFMVIAFRRRRRV